MLEENPKLKIANEGREIIDMTIKALGVSDKAVQECAQIPDEELQEEAMYERMVDRQSCICA